LGGLFCSGIGVDEQMSPTAYMSATEAVARVRDFVLRALGATAPAVAAEPQER
jgi:hypothetical protein